MASLMENLIDILTQESGIYEGLLELAIKKTPVIVAGDLEGLTAITDEEQNVAIGLSNLEKRREEVTKDMATVLNKPIDSMKLLDLIEMLKGRPEEQKRLIEVRDRLQKSVYELKRVNNQNSELLKNALEMVQFEMGLLQAMKTAPETANYSRGAYNTGATMGYNAGGFDAKQ